MLEASRGRPRAHYRRAANDGAADWQRAALGPRARDRGCLRGVASLTGRVALVTGASRGIGADVARMLAAEGARVVCCARTAHDGEHPLEGSLDGTVAAIRGSRRLRRSRCRRTSPATRTASAWSRRRGRPTGPSTSSSTTPRSPSSGRPWTCRCRAGWRRGGSPSTPPFLLSQLVLPEMIERGWGRIVNVTSESAIGPGAAPYDGDAIVGDTAYGAQKAAIERFTQGLAEEVYPSGVGVAAIAPSLIVPTPGRARQRADHGRRRSARGGSCLHARGGPRCSSPTRSSRWPGASSTASSCCSRRG